MIKKIKVMLIALSTMTVNASESINNGFAERQHILGDVYCINQKDTQDYKQASCYRNSAELGDAIAQYNLGVIYSNGEGVKRDFKQAFVWFRKAAEQGHSESQLAIADMYLLGRGVSKDYRLGLDWLLRAAEGGHPPAKLRLALMYDRGMRGVEQNYAQAAIWYMKKIESEHKSNMFSYSKMRLCDMFFKGQWEPEDREQFALVVAWIRKSAELGDNEKQYYLGMMHYVGRGAVKDDHMAIMWFRQAAEQGHSEAQYWLGQMYTLNTVLPRDYMQAYIWFSLSEVNGNVSAASFRKLAADELTATARSEAQALVIKYLEKHTSKSQ
ncbi:sel1 repeat family protein [Aeromonas veronii]|nr:sel1 repeat family protein [Aeromonas veronii]